MSEIFEGVLVAAGIKELRYLNEQALELSALSSGVSVVFRDDARSKLQFAEAIEDLARMLSAKYSRALVVRYDSRIGHRSSEVMDGGRCVASYGENDELFVPLDEDGEPLDDATPIRRENLLQGEEYETKVNAIQLGLNHVEWNVWNELFDLMTS